MKRLIFLTSLLFASSAFSQSFNELRVRETFYLNGQNLVSVSTGDTIATVEWAKSAIKDSTYWLKTGNYIYPSDTTDSLVIGGTMARSLLDLQGNSRFGGFIDMDEISVPAAPAIDNLRLYSYDSGGFTEFGVKMPAGLELDLFRDALHIVRNTSGSDIPAATPVYITGSNGQYPEVAPAYNNDETKMPAYGVTYATISDNGFGRVYQEGDMDSQVTDTLASGAELYVGRGALTDIEPPHPDIVQHMGTVIKSNSSSGIIEIDITGEQHVESGTIRDTFAIGNKTATDIALIFDNGVDRRLYWDDSDTEFEFSEDVNASSQLFENGSRVATRNWSTLQNVTSQGNSTDQILSIIGSNNFPASNNGGLELAWTGTRSLLQSYNRDGDNFEPLRLQGSLIELRQGTVNITSGVLQVDGTGDSYFSGNVGIGATAPDETLDVSGNVKADTVKSVVEDTSFYVWHTTTNQDEETWFEKFKGIIPDVGDRLELNGAISTPLSGNTWILSYIKRTGITEMTIYGVSNTQSEVKQTIDDGGALIISDNTSLTWRLTKYY
jgi:hypothetical protein